MASALQRKRTLMRGRYLEGVDAPQPSVISFNTSVAGAAVVEIMRLATGFAIGAAGYAGGLSLAALADLPAGAASVWMLAAAGLVVALLRASVAPSRPIC